MVDTVIELPGEQMPMRCCCGDVVEAFVGNKVDCCIISFAVDLAVSYGAVDDGAEDDGDIEVAAM